MQKIFKVEGMSCGHCKMNIEKTLMKTTGVQEATVDLQEKSLKVIYEQATIDIDAIVGLVEELGFDIVE